MIVSRDGPRGGGTTFDFFLVAHRLVEWMTCSARTSSAFKSKADPNMRRTVCLQFWLSKKLRLGCADSVLSDKRWAGNLWFRTKLLNERERRAFPGAGIRLIHTLLLGNGILLFVLSGNWESRFVWLAQNPASLGMRFEGFWGKWCLFSSGTLNKGKLCC